MSFSFSSLFSGGGGVGGRGGDVGLAGEGVEIGGCGAPTDATVSFCVVCAGKGNPAVGVDVVESDAIDTKDCFVSTEGETLPTDNPAIGPVDWLLDCESRLLVEA